MMARGNAVPGQPVLAVRGLSVEYATAEGPLHAVREASFEINRGEAVALVGESGSGKTTIAHAALRYLPANGRVRKGRIVFAGGDLADLSFEDIHRLRGRRICLVPQNPATSLNPAMRMGDQLAEVLRHHLGLPSAPAAERVRDMMERVGLPDPPTMARKYPHQLSGGQQQRMLIAMAFATEPELLILDEPTTGLDVTTETRILDLIRDMQAGSGTAILYITHNLAVVRRFCRRVVILYAGEMVEDGPVADVFKRPAHPYTRSLLRCLPGVSTRGSFLETIPGLLPKRYDLTAAACVFAPRCRIVEEHCHDARPPLEEVAPEQRARCYLASRLLSERQASANSVGPTAVGASPEKTLLRVENLCKRYRVDRRTIDALRNVGIEVAKGEILGIVGESGSGKSTLARAIVGLVIPDQGRILFDGTDVTAIPRRGKRGLSRRIQMVFQDPDGTLNPQQSVEKAISRPLDLHGLHRGPERQRRLDGLMGAVHLDPDYLRRYPHQLSGGEKQRVAIARALAVEPDLIICDEPTSSLDVSVQASILNLLMEIRRRYGTTILFISHDLNAVLHLSDSIVVMRDGSVLDSGTSDDLMTRPPGTYAAELFSFANQP